MLYVTQKFNGLDLWDQLSVDIDVQGDVPEIANGVEVHLEDFTEEFISSSPNTLQSQNSITMELGEGEPIPMTIYQNVS